MASPFAAPSRISGQKRRLARDSCRDRSLFQQGVVLAVKQNVARAKGLGVSSRPDSACGDPHHPGSELAWSSKRPVNADGTAQTPHALRRRSAVPRCSCKLRERKRLISAPGGILPRTQLILHVRFTATRIRLGGSSSGGGVSCASFSSPRVSDHAAHGCRPPLRKRRTASACSFMVVLKVCVFPFGIGHEKG